MNIPLVNEEVTPRAYNTALLYLKRRIEYLNRTIKLDGIGELMSYAISLADRLEQNLQELKAVLGSGGTIQSSIRNPVYHPLNMQHSSKVQATLIKNDDLTVSRINNSLVPLNGDLEIFEAEFNIALKEMYDFMDDNYQEIYDVSYDGDSSDSANELLAISISQVISELDRVGFGKDTEVNQAVTEALQEAQESQEEELGEIQETTEELQNQPSVEETISAAQQALDEDEDSRQSELMVQEQAEQATAAAKDAMNDASQARQEAYEELLEANRDYQAAVQDAAEIRDQVGSYEFASQTLGKGETTTTSGGVTVTHNEDDTWTITTTSGSSFTGKGDGTDSVSAALGEAGLIGGDDGSAYGAAIGNAQAAEEQRNEAQANFREAADEETKATQAYQQALEDEAESIATATSDELENGWYNADADDSEPTDYGDFEGWFD